MRRPLVAGNWKMNTDRASAVALADAVVEGMEGSDSVDVALCPPFPYLLPVEERIRGSRVALGAQNLYDKPNGAYTGEVSASMLRDLGCRYVIVGHSERRHILGETDEFINRKVRTALTAGLVPILCVGELIEQRQAGETNSVVENQVRRGLAGVEAEEMARIRVAYEPVWAIGTGHTATPDQAEEVHRYLRTVVAALYNDEIAQSLVIQYGGSVKGDNAPGLLSQPNIDGALVGGASLKADDFMAIVRAGAEAVRGRR